VFWVHAGTRARFEEGYCRIAEATKMSGRDNPKADILRLVRNWLSDKRKGRWLMVVDNADDASVFFQDVSQNRAADGSDVSQAELLSDFLPQSPNGAILFTSRSRDAAYRLTGDHGSIVEVRPMNDDDALALLDKKLGSIARQDEAAELIRTLDYMPLALTQAAAFIRQRAPLMSLSRYINEVRRSDADRARLLERDVGDSRRDGRASNSIMTTWQISFEYIRKQTPTAARLLSLMSLFDRQGIPESLLQKRYRRNQDEDKDEEKGAHFDDDIHTLISFSLVEVGVYEQEFEMHRLVQFSTKKWLELSNKLEQWKQTYVMLMDESYPVGRHKNWPACQALFPHAAAVLDSRPENAEGLKAWASVLFKASWYAGEIGQYEAAENMNRIALEEKESLLGLEHPSTLTSVSNQAVVLQYQGKYEAAEAMNRRALEGYEKALGNEHPDTLTSLDNLAVVLQYQGKYEAAEAMNRRALEGREKALGNEHPYTLTSVSNLAVVLQYQGKYEAAEAMNRRALGGREKALGNEHPNTLTSVSNLAVVLRYQGKYEAAEAMNRRALEGREKALGNEHPNTLTSASNLAVVLQYQGKYEAAEAMNRRALEGREKALGNEHPNTLTSASNLAGVLQYQGKYEAAEAMNRRALGGREKALGRKHPDTLTSVYCLAFLSHRWGRYEEAMLLYTRASTGYTIAFGPDHPTTQACLYHQLSLEQLLH
jgi:tetratricopeptide (TPR) repeat protein